MSISEPLMQSVLIGEAVEHAPVAILVSDEEGRYVAANEHACELLGYTREELLGPRRICDATTSRRSSPKSRPTDATMASLS